MKVNFVDLKSQYMSIKEDIDSSIQSILDETAFIGGKHLKQFEENFANYIGSEFAVGCGNGTDALVISLKALGIGPGDEVITVANTFVATAEAIALVGAKPVFVDCNEDTYNIDTQKIEEKINQKTKAIIPVHLYGQPCDLSTIQKLARKHNLKIIEDCAQAHGAKLNGKTVGTTGEFGCFSFYPGKNLGAYGDGGAFVTDDKDLSKNARMYSNHGRLSKYDHEFVGVNSRLDTLQAKILDVKLKSLDKWNETRRMAANIYKKELDGLFKYQREIEGSKGVYHLFVIECENRDDLKNYLANNGISTGIHYPIPLPSLKAFDHLNINPKDYEVSLKLSKRILSLPIHGNITEEEVNYVVEKLKKF